MSIYGPQPEIDRFKRWFVVRTIDARGREELELDFTGLFRHTGHYNHALQSHGEKPWGFEDWEQDAPGCYHFKFDTWRGFPEELFENLVEMFPHVMFDCSNIASDSSEIGYGWYNGPRDGDKFAYYEMSEGYWESGGPVLRDKASQPTCFSRGRLACIRDCRSGRPAGAHRCPGVRSEGYLAEGPLFPPPTQHVCAHVALPSISSI